MTARPQRPPAKMGRRDALRLFGGAAAATMLGACGSSEATIDLANARLSAIMRRPFIPSLEQVGIDRANEWAATRNADITLHYADDWRERYQAVADDRQGDDVAELFGTDTLRYGDRLVDVSELAEQIGERGGGWMDAARASAVVDGRWRAVPWAFTAHALNVRPSIFDAAGCAEPTTYAELIECATRLRDERLPLMGLSMGPTAPNDSASVAYSMLWAHGASEVDESGRRVALDSAATRECLRQWKNLVEVSAPDSIAFDEAGNNEAFLNGDISCTQNAASIYWRALREVSDIADDMTHVAYPAGPGGFHQLVEMNLLGVFDHSRNRDAAIDWVEAMSTPESLNERASLSLTFFSPPLLSSIDDPALPWNQLPQLEAMKRTHLGGRLPGWPGPPSIEASLAYANGTIVNMFRTVGVGEETVDNAVRAATAALRRVYET